MNRAVKHLHMHQAPFIPGVGNLKNTFTPSDMLGVKMLYTPEGVLVDYKGASFIVPLANVVTAVFVDNGVIAQVTSAA